MKNIGKVILVISFLFLSALPVLAVNKTQVNAVREETTQGTGSGSITTTRQENTLETKVATFAGKLDVRKKEIIKNYFRLMIRRLQAAVNRLNKIIIRIACF